NPVAHFMYPGITDPAFPGINWTEGSAGNAPEDRRMMGSIGPMAFDQGYVISVDVATLFVNGGQPAMRTAAAYVDSIFQNNIALQVPVVLAEPQLNLFPNPAVNSFKITGNAERINIINAQGVIVQTVDNYQQQFINIQHLPSGVYAVQCINGAKINTIRLCKR
ncbi:MAG TPA: T9SS type A sorting domain-containing protein, partial [Bacteroidia bacterium]|nr:T9SS type A sorting domain-containing protein [Bacteroidia bacterium]